jgi:DNA repair protein RadC
MPSFEDKTLTKKIKEGAALLDILVLDHLIIGQKTYYSFADCGEL